MGNFRSKLGVNGMERAILYTGTVTPRRLLSW
jgi:hypothetical protein